MSRHFAHTNFDVLIVPNRRERHYSVHVQDTPAGSASADFVFPETDEDLALLTAWNSSKVTKPDQLRRLGERLFDSVFVKQIAERLRTCQAMLSADRGTLRINLRLDSVPELANLPWEYLYDTANQRFLSLSDLTPVIRYLNLSFPEPVIEQVATLRILVAISSPKLASLPVINVENEKVKLQQALAPLIANGAVTCEYLEHVTWQNLQSTLQRSTFHVVHFIGHGDFDTEENDGVLILENEDGSELLVRASDLGDLLQNHRSIRLVVLNSCKGARNSPNKIFSGIAHRLVQRGIPAVLAMQADISDFAALRFSEAFYEALSYSYPIDKALTQARLALSQHFKTEWGTPVFVTFSKSILLFDLVPRGQELKGEMPKNYQSPFVGTIAYSPEQASFFFGRDERINDLYKRVTTGYTPWLLINGKSGAGKTSILRAGLMPILTDAGYEVIYCRIVDAPLRDVIDGIGKYHSWDSKTANDLVSILNQVFDRDNQRVFLIIDHLERCFTFAKDDKERAEFWKSISRLLNNAVPSLAKIVFAIRADWLYFIQEESEHLLLAYVDHLYYLEPLTKDEAISAIAGPFTRSGVSFEPELPKRIVDDLLQGDYVYPPHLQIIGERLYREYQLGSQMDCLLYERLGGADAIIRNRFEEVMASMGPNRDLCWQILSRFIGDSDLRMTIYEADLLSGIDDKKFYQIIQNLINHSVVSREISSDSGLPVYTLTHDSILDELRKYFGESDEAARWMIARRYLESGYTDWQAVPLLSERPVLDAARYRYIWEHRSHFQDIDDSRAEYLMHCALLLGDSSFAYWLTVVTKRETNTEGLSAEKLSEVTNTILNNFLLSQVSDVRQKARHSVLHAINSEQVSEDTKDTFAQKLFAAFAQPSTKAEELIPILWTLRKFLTLGQNTAIVPALSTQLIRDNLHTIRSAFWGSIAVVLVVLAFVTVNAGLTGTWYQQPINHIGEVSMSYMDEKEEYIYAITNRGPQSGDSATLARYDIKNDKWAILSKNLSVHGITAFLAVNSQEQTRLYVSRLATGIVRSDDNGVTWQQVNTGLHSYYIGTLVADPLNPNMIYAASEDLRGVFMTTNGGDSWADINSPDLFGASVLSMAVASYGGEGRLLVGTDDGRILKYSPNTAMWSQVSVFPGAGRFHTLSGTAQVATTLYAGTHNGKIFRSDNGGDTWLFLGTIPSTFVVELVAVAPSRSQNPYAVTYGYGGYILWESKDSGETWSKVANTDFSRSRVTSILVSSIRPGTIYLAGTSGFMETSDGGQSWRAHDLGTPITAPDQVVASPVEYGPVYITSGSRILTGELDANENLNWKSSGNVPALVVRDILPDPSSADVAYAAVYVPQEWSVFKTNDRGNTWVATGKPPIAEANVSDTTTLAATEVNGILLLYAGTNGCGTMHSLDGGESWETFGRNDCTLDDDAPENIFDIVVDPFDPDHIYVAADDSRVYASQDRGKTWTMSDPPILTEITKIAVDPSVNGRMYLIAGADLFWRSDDYGQTWAKHSNGIGAVSLMDMVITMNGKSSVVVIADSGEVWHTLDGGSKWTPIRENLTAVGLRTVTVNSDSELIVGSYEGGLYRRKSGFLEKFFSRIEF